MQAFRTTLMILTALVAILTITAVINDGPNLITPFFGAVFALGWPGQFHVDFTCYLVLSGIWMAWRSGFSRSGIALGLLAPPLGILFFGPYLIYLIRQTKGDAKALLLGAQATR